MSLLKILSMAIDAATAAIEQGALPKDGAVLYERKLGHDPRFFYTQQIRLYPDGMYRVHHVHSSGHIVRPWWERSEGTLLDAVQALLQGERDYDRTDAEETAAAVHAEHLLAME
jgi:hypothetical protein